MGNPSAGPSESGWQNAEPFCAYCDSRTPPFQRDYDARLICRGCVKKGKGRKPQPTKTERALFRR